MRLEVLVEAPPRVEYSLSEAGRPYDALLALGDWGEEDAEHIISLSATA